MKILLVANTDWYVYNFRLSLAKFLRERGHEVVFVSPGGPFIKKIEQNGFRTIEWHVSRSGVNVGAEVKALLNLFAVYRTEKPTLVHHFTVKPVLYGSLAAQFASVPGIVNSITGLGYVFLDKKPLVRLLRGLVIQSYRWLFRKKTLRVIFENGDDRQFFIAERIVSAQKSSVVQGVGVDIDRFRPVPEPSGDPLVVFPSRMLIDKGLGVLVEAVKRIRLQVAIRVALVGNIDSGNPATVSEETIRSWEKQGLVEWWGFRNDMESVFQQCHIVTLPSFGEGLPTSLIEAAASGRPIVATDVPGCRDVVIDQRNGLLVPPQDANALAEALVTLVNNPTMREAMGRAGRKLAEDRFCGSKINNQIYSIYQDLTKDHLNAPSIF